MSLVLPAAGLVVAAVPSVATAPEALVGRWQARAPERRLVLVPARPRGVGDLPLGDQLAAERVRLRSVERGDALALAPELRTLLLRPWRELGRVERYLAGVVRARLGGADVVVLDQPGSALPALRLRTLISALGADGVGVVWLERRLRLPAALGLATWLIDREIERGPVESHTLLDDEAAWTLCFGGGLDPAPPEPPPA